MESVASLFSGDCITPFTFGSFHFIFPCFLFRCFFILYFMFSFAFCFSTGGETLLFRGKSALVRNVAFLATLVATRLPTFYHDCQLRLPRLYRIYDAL